jgi:large subunit ribosomal protein L49
MASTSQISSLARRQLLPISTRTTSTSLISLRSLSTAKPHLYNPLRASLQNPSIETLSPWFQQHRTFIAKLTRKSQAATQTVSSRSTSRIGISSSTELDPPLQLTNLPYYVRRTPSHQLPVYLITKSGGTKKQTSIRKTEGDLDALRNDLARYLGLESGDEQGPKSPEVEINRRTGHIIIKGWRKDEVQNFLLERNF